MNEKPENDREMRTYGRMGSPEARLIGRAKESDEANLRKTGGGGVRRAGMVALMTFPSSAKAPTAVSW